MKWLTLFVALTIIIACSSEHTSNQNRTPLPGKWQNTQDPQLILEFTNSGEYRISRSGNNENEYAENFNFRYSIAMYEKADSLFLSEGGNIAYRGAIIYLNDSEINIKLKYLAHEESQILQANWRRIH